MKRLLTLLTVLVVVSLKSWAVAVHAVQEDRVVFYNFSAGPYDMTGHILTVGTTQYNVNGLNVLMGALATTAGMYTELALPANAPAAAGSVALWAPGTTFPNPSFALLVSYVAWGAAGQAYEAQAVDAGKWQLNAFVNFTLPIRRNGDYSTNGAANWYSTMGLDDAIYFTLVDVYPSPFTNRLNLKFEQGHNYTTLLLYSVCGQVLYQRPILQETTALSIHTYELKPGIYLLELRKANGYTQVKRLVKKQVMN
jgi:hypothetical protein